LLIKILRGMTFMVKYKYICRTGSLDSSGLKHLGRRVGRQKYPHPRDSSVVVTPSRMTEPGIVMLESRLVGTKHLG
jgi:hypothetical protein